MSVTTTDVAGPNYTLTVNTGTHGTVTKTPDQATYPPGTVVTLMANANANYKFIKWTGAVGGTVNPVTITMDNDKTVNVTFSAGIVSNYTLTVTASNGTVTKSPNQATYPASTPTASTVVTLTAEPNAGYHFTGWTGDLTGSENPKTINMNGNKAVTANFASGGGGPYTLTVNATNGTVVKTPDAADYASGTSVSLQANADAGYHFTTWSGDATGTTNPVAVTMNRDKTVTAYFALPTYTVLASYQPGPPWAVRKDATTYSDLVVKSARQNVIKANMLTQSQYATILAYGSTPDNATVASAYDSPMPGWPLNVGDTWGFTKHTWDDQAIVDITGTREGKVLAIEDVTVNAGTADEHTYHNCAHIVEYDPAIPGTITYEHWFSETVGSDVKMIDRETYLGVETRELKSTNYVPSINYTLTVTADHGTVTKTPDAEEYPAGTSVSLHA